MLELSITNYQMRRPPMATNTRALDEMPASQIIHKTTNDYVLKTIATAEAIERQGQIQIQRDAAGIQHTLSRNFKDAIGTVYFRENRKLHFEIETPYEEIIEIKAFFSKKVEKKHHVACITGVVPFTFENLAEIRLSGNRITFTYSMAPDLKSQFVRFGFEMAEMRQFARDIYEWAERKGFKLMKPVDEDYKEEDVKKPEAPTPPPEGQLYSVMIEPDNAVVEYGQSVHFQAKPMDVKGNTVQTTGLKWTIDPQSIGKMEPNGVFTPITNSGKGNVVVTVSQGAITTHGFSKVSIIPTTSGHSSASTSQYPHPSTPPPTASQAKMCPTCSNAMTFYPQYNRSFCHKCNKWD